MSSDFKFLDLVHFLHRLNNVKRGNNNDFSEYGRATITQIRRIIIEEFVSDWRHHYHQEIPFLKVLRMVLPDKDTSRKYNMKETSLINSILQAYGVTKQSEEYRRLNNGHIFDNHREKYIKARKVATAMAEIISKRQPGVKGGVLTLLQVDEYLDLLSLKLMALEEDDPTNKSPVKPFEVLRRMFALMNHDELELAILIILKYKIIGHSQTALLRSWHKDAPEYFSAVMSLEAVCNRFEDPESILAESEKSAQVLLPFSPQLAFHPKSSYEEIVKAFNGEFFIEEKLDGERLQLHMKRTGEEPLDFTFRFYSRKGTDYTENYGADMTSGTLAPYMREVIDEKRLKALQSLILDGEVMGYDTKRQVVLPFGTLKAVNIEAMYKESSFRPVYVIFDVLMINGRALGNTPLSNKKALLLKLINPKPGYIEVVHSEEAHSVEDIKNAMKDAVEANSEGIMVKQKSSRYKLGARDPCWVKIKPEYLQELGSDLDLVVIGKITQKKTSYFCGLRVDNEDGSAQNLFYSFCKIANGIGSSDLEKIESLLSQKWHKFEEDPPPENILQFGSTKPSYWIDPQNSIVLQVKARSIEYGLYGRGYKVGSTIISGYMKSIRDDKSWKDALSLGEFMDWQRSEVVATSSGRSFEARKKVVKRQKVDIGENPLSFVSLQSDLFINLNFMILSDYKPDNLERLETSKLQQLAKSFGATVCVSERNEYGPIHNLIPLATKNTLKVHSLYNMGYDIIHCSWLLDCIGAREILPFEPRHCFRVLSSVYEAALKSLDNKGDGFFSNLNSSLFEKVCLVSVTLS